ncbi:PTS glucose transporter subunit IIA [Halobacillus sp. A5]|uniref:PTS sugar transporter subunit IIA n=1 Tax=Halobacillus sp. A5 TaxID=2880263 RepID=UPI0020A6202D|nr:PTS glucose transporter subunit IIA [Halobacillus sp. A5]MCP3027407.1 PTS glucose transporter subunit IIA [Halobacillus sp. A5]
MFKKLFGHKEKTVEVVAPVNGRVVDLKEVPDPVFAEKMMGEGLAVKPADGEVFSPVEGEVVQLFPTNHAIGLKTRNGVEVLIHIGLETVSMEGEGFKPHVSQGDKVKAGDKLITFDKGLVEEKAKSSITPIIITNSNDLKVQLLDSEEAAAGTTVLMKVHNE